MRDLLSWLGRYTSSGEQPPDVDEDLLTDLAAEARGETVTVDVLVNQDNRTNRPIVEYLEEDERPQFVFRGAGLLLSDPDGSVTREYPTRETLISISERRILFVVGGRLSDGLFEVPLEDVVEVYLDEASIRRYLIVEADREDDRMTFFADITLESAEADVDRGIEYIRDAALRGGD